MGRDPGGKHHRDPHKAISIQPALSVSELRKPLSCAAPMKFFRILVHRSLWCPALVTYPLTHEARVFTYGLNSFNFCDFYLAAPTRDMTMLAVETVASRRLPRKE